MPSPRSVLRLIVTIASLTLGVVYGMFALALALPVSIPLGVLIVVVAARREIVRAAWERNARVQIAAALELDAERRDEIATLRQEALPDVMVMRAYLRNVGG